MKISVGSRSSKSGTEPCRLLLGRSSLPVAAVLNRRQETDACSFEVRVLDGRRFIVRHRPDLDGWELVAVCGRGPTRRLARVAASPLLMPLLLALYRKSVEAAKRKCRWREAPGAVPRGSAPA